MTNNNRSIGYLWNGWICRVTKLVGSLTFVRYVGVDGNLEVSPTYFKSKEQAQLLCESSLGTFHATREEIRLARIYSPKEKFLSLPGMEGIGYGN